MAKAGKLTKLRSALKKINSFGKLRRESSGNSITPPTVECHVSSGYSDGGLRTVYVGKSHRRYQVSSEVLDHPVIQDLVSRSDGCDESTTIIIGCEIVLFEHLLWMLQNSPQLEPLDDLVGFYAY